MIAAWHGGSAQNRKRELGKLLKERALHLPKQQYDAYNARYSPRIYANPDSVIGGLFWHQLMISDLMLSIEVWSKENGRRFRHRHELIGNVECELPASIAYQFARHHETYDKPYRPDELFAIDDLWFILEADRDTETVEASTLKTTSWLRKILQLREILRNRTYQTVWGAPSLFVLVVTTDDAQLNRIIHVMTQTLGVKSASLHLKSLPILGSKRQHPNPLYTLLTDPWQRVGHPPQAPGETTWTKSSSASVN